MNFLGEDFEETSTQVERLVGRIAQSYGLRLEKDGSAYIAGFRLYKRSNKRKFISVTIQDNEFHGDIEYKVSTISPGKIRTERHYNFQNFMKELENQVDSLVFRRKMAQSVILRVAMANLKLKGQKQLFMG